MFPKGLLELLGCESQFRLVGDCNLYGCLKSGVYLMVIIKSWVTLPVTFGSGSKCQIRPGTGSELRGEG